MPKTIIFIDEIQAKEIIFYSIICLAYSKHIDSTFSTSEHLEYNERYNGRWLW